VHRLADVDVFFEQLDVETGTGDAQTASERLGITCGASRAWESSRV